MARRQKRRACCCLLSCSFWRSGVVGVNPPPDAEKLLQLAAAPLAAGWLSPNDVRSLARPEASCTKVLVALDWIVQCLHAHFISFREEAHVWQDLLVQDAYEGQPAHEFFRSDGYRALLQPVLSMHRLSLNTMDFVQVLALLHGERCFHAELRSALGPAVVALSELSAEAHRIQLSSVFHGMLSFWDSSTDVVRHVDPVWNVIGHSAKFADAMSQVRIVLDRLRTPEGGISLPKAASPPWQDEGGAFSEMHFLIRKLTGGWHLDHGLLTSLLRLWRPSSEKTSVADFGAGGGHYCNFFNRTGEFSCHAFDGTPHAAEHSGGAVQTQRLDQPFDLGRQFDWVLCLEVAEHLPPEAEGTFLGNLRRHTAHGLVLSWSENAGEEHPNSKPWPEVHQALQSVGFLHDENASDLMRPQVPWLRGAVHVFRIATHYGFQE